MPGAKHPLAKRFVSHLTAAQQETIGDLAGLEQLLARGLSEAQRAWTSTTLDAEAFVDHIAARVPAEGDLLPAVEQMHLSDLFACACTRGDARALELFDKRLLAGLDRVLHQLRLPLAAHEDVKQQLRADLLVSGSAGEEPGIARYAGSGRLASWLHVIAVRTARYRYRKELSIVLEEEAALERAVHHVGDAEAEHLKRVYRREFKAAFREGLESIGERERTLLKLAHVDGLTLEKIAELYRAPRSTAARWVANARALLVERTRAALRGKLGATPEECVSVMRLIESQIDFTLPSFFRGKRPAK